MLRALGVDCALDGTSLRVRGAGLHGLAEPTDVMDCGNSGTTIRLMAGVLAGQPFHSVLTGDASLRTRPMARVVEPLREMGAHVDARAGGTLAPMAIRGGGLHGIRCRLPVASAQTKSAILLAALFAEGDTTVEEPGPTRDHTERMLDAMGARIEREGPAVRLTPGASLMPLSMRVPNDISAAAFWMVAAAAHPDAELHLTGIGLNPTRTGIIDALREMGADLAIEEERRSAESPVGDVVVPLVAAPRRHGRWRSDAAHDRRSAGVRCCGRARIGDDGNPRRGGTACEGVRPHRRRGVGAVGAGRAV